MIKRHRMYSDINLLQILIHALLALFAGMMKELNKLNKQKKFNFGKLIAGGCVSSFVGVTTFFLCEHFQVGAYMTAFLTSIAGWMGGSLMDFFGESLKRFITKKIDITFKDKNDVEYDETKETDGTE